MDYYTKYSTEMFHPKIYYTSRRWIAHMVMLNTYLWSMHTYYNSN